MVLIRAQQPVCIRAGKFYVATLETFADLCHKLDEIGITIGADETYIPKETVLRRCDCAGYCTATGTECRAASTQTVEVIFKVVTHVGVDSMRFQRYNVTDHVSCSCQ
ncbi:hypothetical protein C0J52_13426 [Blattella germanica]|nr:hypothetical protein C0J52_13426 [Blattella germanica]